MTHTTTTTQEVASTVIFTAGDTALYRGPAETSADGFLVAGHVVTVREGNEDHDDDAVVERDGARFQVSAQHLEWLPST